MCAPSTGIDEEGTGNLFNRLVFLIRDWSNRDKEPDDINDIVSIIDSLMNFHKQMAMSAFITDHTTY